MKKNKILVTGGTGFFGCSLLDMIAAGNWRDCRFILLSRRAEEFAKTHPEYTALENVTLAGKLLAKEREDYKSNKKQIFTEIEEHGRELLAQMGLSDRADHYPHQLSGGQQQRVAIARALALKPDILCFDEPTSALDPELTGEVLKVIRGLAEQKTTMVIVTHEMAFARDVADRVIFMDGGIIVEEGDARQVIENPREERTRQFLSRYAEN